MREKPRPARKEEPDQGRRDFLKLGAGAAALGALAAAGLRDLQGKEGKAPIDKGEGPRVDVPLPPKRPHIAEFLTLEAHPRSYDTEALAGRKFGAPISTYFGHTGVFSARTQVDFRYQLGEMWRDKLQKLGLEPDERAPVERTINEIVMGYDPDHAMQMSGAYYYAELSDAVRLSREEVDWHKMREHFKLSADQYRFLLHAERFLDAETLFAIGLTELMPALGSMTFPVFDTILKTGGYEFMLRVPSGGDDLMSIGPGQTTAKLFTDTKDAQGSLTIMNRLLKHPLLPHSVTSLRERQHHIASYLNALFNLGWLSKDLTNVQAYHLSRAPVGDDIRLFISGANNVPTAAISSFKRFADAYRFAQRHDRRTHPHFAAFAVAPIRSYVHRSDENLREVRRHGGLEAG